MSGYIKQLPHNDEAEKYLLGAMMINPKAIDIAKQYIKPQSMFDTKHNVICEAIFDLYYDNEPVDEISVSERIKKYKKSIAKIDLKYLSDMAFACNSAHVEMYAKIVAHTACRRMYIMAAQAISQMAYEGDDVPLDEIRANALGTLNFDIPGKNNADDMASLFMATQNAINELDEMQKSAGAEKLYTGLGDLDAMMGGLHKSEMTIIGARPSVGKTAFALQIAHRLAKKGNTVLFISREMRKEQLATRLMIYEGAVDAAKARFPQKLTFEDFAEMQEYNSKITENLYIDDKTSTFQGIMAKCQEMVKTEQGLDVLFVDYLSLVQSAKRRESRRLEIEDCSMAFKKLAMDLNIPVVVLSQLSRENVKNNAAPELHHLRETGQIEQDADNVMFLHRPKINGEEQDPALPNQEIHVLIRKQRNGPLACVETMYENQYFRFVGIHRDYTSMRKAN